MRAILAGADHGQTGEIGRLSDRGDHRLGRKTDGGGQGTDDGRLAGSRCPPEQYGNPGGDGQSQGLDKGRLILHPSSVPG